MNTARTPKPIEQITVSYGYIDESAGIIPKLYRVIYGKGKKTRDE